MVHVDDIVAFFFSSHGYYRDVWVFDQPDLEVKCILKRSRYSFDFTIKTFHTTLRDALIMERLSGSPRIVDLYGHCGSSVSEKEQNSIAVPRVFGR